jgi:hypothetical protein
VLAPGSSGAWRVTWRILRAQPGAPAAISPRMWRCLVLAVLLSQPACESCEFSYGSYEVQGTVTVDGPVPADLAIRFCTSAHADNCIDGSFTPPATSASTVSGSLPVTYMLDDGVPSEGTWSCSYEKHWLVITGTGCEETAIDVTAQPETHTVDATLYCG